MSFFDSLFSGRVTPDTRTRERVVSQDISTLDGKDVIMADPDTPLPAPAARPPIVFANG